MKRYKVIERVEFEYVWIVSAIAPEDAMARVEKTADGESVEQSLVDREFISVRVFRPRRKKK